MVFLPEGTILALSLRVLPLRSVIVIKLSPAYNFWYLTEADWLLSMPIISVSSVW